MDQAATHYLDRELEEARMLWLWAQVLDIDAGRAQAVLNFGMIYRKQGQVEK